MSEQRERFLDDYRLNYYSVSELAQRFSISRKTAHKWIARFEEHGLDPSEAQQMLRSDTATREAFKATAEATYEAFKATAEAAP